MPRFNPDDPLAIPQLYQHSFDIDDIIAALCGAEVVWLDTTQGRIYATKPQAPASHCFCIEPLPASFLAELATHPDLRLLTEPEQHSLRALLTTHRITDLPNLFQEGRIGGWLRERVKDVALEWLDMHDLIPPSMRHINRRTDPVGPRGVATSGKISILEQGE